MIGFIWGWDYARVVNNVIEGKRRTNTEVGLYNNFIILKVS